LLGAYYFIRKHNTSKTAALIELMCYSIPISWRNIFGGSFASLPVPWFYIIGALLALRLVMIKSPISKKMKWSTVFLVLVQISVVFLSLGPLAITKYQSSIYFTEAVGQFITLSFYNILILLCIAKGSLLEEKDMFRLRQAYVFGGLITSIGVIIQFSLHYFGGILIGNIEFALNRVLYLFMFIDISSGSLYLISTAFMMILFKNDFKMSRSSYILTVGTIVIATSITSARTGIISFFIVFSLYLFSKKGILKKLTGFASYIVLLFVVLTFFSFVRPMDNSINYVINSSGRISGYKIAWDLFVSNPIIGTGFGRTHTFHLMGGRAIPHLTFLQYLVQTGIIYTTLIFGIIFYALIKSWKNSIKEGWVLLLTLVGSFFIPDIFSSRFILIVMLFILLNNKSVAIDLTMEE